jgi:LAO/AO transport system kinase
MLRFLPRFSSFVAPRGAPCGLSRSIPSSLHLVSTSVPSSSLCSISSDLSSSRRFFTSSQPSATASSPFPSPLTSLSAKNIALADGLLSGDRSSLSRAITLVESSLPEHQLQADLLFRYLAQKCPSKPKFFQNKQTFRLGIAGPPGGGKSTLIEMVGLELVKQGHRVAVIPVDPSSTRSGGSILGDKTRMEELSKSTSAYVRPSPTRGILGGIAEHTADVIELCEYSGYDTVIVESVGLGQSEVELDDAVDMFVLLVNPGGGDDLQASKKGVMEAVDLLVISKADGDLLTTARHTKSDYSISINLIRPKTSYWTARAQLISSKTQFGLTEFLSNISEYHSIMSSNHQIEKKRQDQRLHWFYQHFRRLVMNEMESNSRVAEAVQEIKDQVAQGKISSREGARDLLKAFESVSRDE